MVSITNRILEKSTGFTHTQIKRWAVAFLEPDKASGQHSGVPRIYDFDQAIRIYLGGYLVRDLKFTLDESKQILNDLTNWLKNKSWKFSGWVDFRESKLSSGYVAGINFPWRGLLIDIGLGSDDRLFYVAKILSVKKMMREPNHWREEYDLEYFGKLSPISTMPLRSIDIEAMVRSLANIIAQVVSE